MSVSAQEDSSDSLPRVVYAVPLKPESHWAYLRKTLGRIGDKTLSIAVFSVALAGLLVPPAVFFVSGVWGSVTYVKGVLTLWDEISTWRLADMFASLAAVDTSGGFALAGVSYFALIFSFIVLFGGLLGHRWQRIFVMPGILLCAANVIIFTFAATLSFSVIASHFLLPDWLKYPLIGYVLLNALLLAAMLLDVRPSRRHRRGVRHRHHRETIIDEAKVSSKPVPVVRFGPPQPQPETAVSDMLSQPAAVLAPPPPAVSTEVDTMPVALSIAEVAAEATSEEMLALLPVETITAAQTETEATAVVSSMAP